MRSPASFANDARLMLRFLRVMLFANATCAALQVALIVKCGQPSNVGALFANLLAVGFCWKSRGKLERSQDELERVDRFIAARRQERIAQQRARDIN